MCNKPDDVSVAAGGRAEGAPAMGVLKYSDRLEQWPHFVRVRQTTFQVESAPDGETPYSLALEEIDGDKDRLIDSNITASCQSVGTFWPRSEWLVPKVLSTASKHSRRQLWVDRGLTASAIRAKLSREWLFGARSHVNHTRNQHLS